MTTIDQIKQQCREIIELAEKATPGPWIVVGEKTGQCGVLQNIEDNPDHVILDGGSYLYQKDAQFIAAARSFTPQAARALLGAIEMFELLHASSALDAICREWEESK